MMPQGKAPIPINRSMVRVKVGSRSYDAVREPTCMTCTHPARHEIEELITQGHTYRSVANKYSEVEWTDADGSVVTLPKVTTNSVVAHFQRGHMPAQAEAMRRIVERRAESIGAAQFEDQINQIVDHHIFAEQVLHKTQERLIRGEIEPDVKDGMAAAKFLADIEAASHGSLDAEAWSDAMQRYFEVAQAIMPPDMWEHFTKTLATDPILLSISNRLAGRTETVDAEIVDTTESD